jgi:hypothetical protein
MGNQLWQMPQGPYATPSIMSIGLTYLSQG